MSFLQFLCSFSQNLHLYIVLRKNCHINKRTIYFYVIILRRWNVLAALLFAITMWRCFDFGEICHKNTFFFYRFGLKIYILKKMLNLMYKPLKQPPTSSSLSSGTRWSRPSSIRYSTMHSTCSDMFGWSMEICKAALEVSRGQGMTSAPCHPTLQLNKSHTSSRDCFTVTSIDPSKYFRTAGTILVNGPFAASHHQKWSSKLGTGISGRIILE